MAEVICFTQVFEDLTEITEMRITSEIIPPLLKMFWSRLINPQMVLILHLNAFLTVIIR